MLQSSCSDLLIFTVHVLCDSRLKLFGLFDILNADTYKTQNIVLDFTRDELVSHLEAAKIQTRMLFAGNLIKHPCFDEMRNSGEGYRVVGELKNTDTIMNDTFWIGVYPGMTQEKLDYIIQCFDKFIL